MDIKSFLDSTYLKTAEQAGISDNENRKLVFNCIQEAIDEKFKLVMILPEMVSLAKKMVTDQKSKINIGTVIDFPKGNSNYSKKIKEAKQAIIDGADDLDFVCNYGCYHAGGCLVFDKLCTGLFASISCFSNAIGSTSFSGSNCFLYVR